MPDQFKDSFLLSIGDQVKGISPGIEKPNTLIVTCAKQGIRIYEVFDQQCIKNWTTPAKLSFRGSTVQDRKSRCFFSQTGTSTIASWPHNALDILSRTEKEFEEDIFQLQCGSVKRKKWSAVAVTKTESIILLDHKMNMIHVLSGDSSRCVVWSQHLTMDGDDYVMTLYKKDNTYYFHVFTLYNEPSIRERSVFELEINSEREIESSCFQQEGSPYLAILWNNGDCDVWQFESISHLTNRDRLPLHKLQTTYSNFTTKKEQKRKIFALSPSLFAIVGATSSKQVELCTYNALWGTLLEKQILPKTKGKSITHAVLLKDSNCAVLAMGNDLCICKLKQSSGTLAEAMGSIGDISLYPGVPDDGEFGRRDIPLCVDGSLSMGVFLQPQSFNNSNQTNLLSIQYLSNLKGDNEYEYHVVEILINQEHTSNEKDFMEVFTSYVQSRTRLNIGGKPYEHFRREKPNSSSWNEFFDFDTTKSVKLSAYFVSSVAQRCIESKFWDALLYLITSGLLSFSLVNHNFLEELMKEKQLNLLHACLCKLKDLDEPSVARLLKYFINNRNESFVKKYLCSVLKTDKGPNGFQFINLIINLPTNEAFTTHSIYGLDTSEVIVLMEYLLKYLKVYSGSSTTKLELKSIGVPKYKNVIKWIGMIIDAHSTNLLLANKGSIELLAQMKNELSLQVDICENIRNMKGCLAHILQRRSMPRTSQQNYSIEVFYA